MLSARFEPKTTTNIAIFADTGKIFRKIDFIKNFT